MRNLLIAAALLACGAHAPSERKAQPLAPGRYCLKQHLTAYSRTDHYIDLGEFVMIVEVDLDRGRYAVSIGNQMPDNPQILEAETDDAKVMQDGSLAFRFTDGWDNRGQARIYPSGKTVLVMTKRAPMNQIERNYGTFTVFKSDCVGVDFR